MIVMIVVMMLVMIVMMGDDSYDVDYDSYDGVDGVGKQYVYVVDVEDDTDYALITIVTTKEIDACCC